MKQRYPVRRSSSERGSALLIVFLMAAIVAIMLYRELPVAAFEAKRAREELLAYRAGEYVRAVQLYNRALKQYPPNMEALENTNRLRFLRRRYKDPFTGKDDWRILHAGPNGVIIDSKIKAKNTPQNLTANPQGANTGFGNSGAGNFGTNSVGAPGGANSQSSITAFNGATSGSSPAAPGASPAATSQAASATVNAGFSGYYSAAYGGSAGANGETVVPEVRQRNPAVAANGSQTPTTSRDSAAAVPLMADMGSPPVATVNAPVENELSSQRSATQQNTITTGGFNGPPQNTGAAQTSGFGANAGSSFGTNVNTGVGGPSGFGLTNNTTSTNRSGSTLQSGGIAGVASKATGRSIREVNDQQEYSLWEFFYDPSKDTSRNIGGLPTSGGATNANQNAGKDSISGFNSSSNQSTTTNGTNGTSTPSPSGSTGFSGFNNGSSNVADPVPISPGQTQPPQQQAPQQTPPQ